jgi:hypothetical protein
VEFSATNLKRLSVEEKIVRANFEAMRHLGVGRSR